MEEILRDLIINCSSNNNTRKGLSVSKPCRYFNLSSSRNWNSYEPTSHQILQQYHKCMNYLKNSYQKQGGFSSYISSDPNDFHEDGNKTSENNLEEPRGETPEFPEKESGGKREIFTSILALDILNNLSAIGTSWDDSDSEEEEEEERENTATTSTSGSTSPTSSSSSQHSRISTSSSGSNGFTIDDLNEIVEFITPASGLASFSLYKRNEPEINSEEDGDDEKGEDEMSTENNLEMESNFMMITSLAISVLLETGNLHPEPAKIVARILKLEMLNRFQEFLQSDTIDNEDIEIDPIECCMLMRLLYQLDLSDGTDDIQDFLYEYLEQKLYLSSSSNMDSNDDNDKINEQSKYFKMEFSPDAFLYFLTRAVMTCSSTAEDIFKDLLSERILERLGYGCGFGFNSSNTTTTTTTENLLASSLVTENNNSPQADLIPVLYNNNNNSNKNPRRVSPINLAMRILALHELGLLHRKSVKSSIFAGEIRVLLKSQTTTAESELDDACCWPSDYICKLNQSTFFGGRQVTHIFVLKALSVFNST